MKVEILQSVHPNVHPRTYHKDLATLNRIIDVATQFKYDIFSEAIRRRPTYESYIADISPFRYKHGEVFDDKSGKFFYVYQYNCGKQESEPILKIFLDKDEKPIEEPWD